MDTDRIERLMHEAGEGGDEDTAIVCARALNGDAAAWTLLVRAWAGVHPACAMQEV